MIDDHLHQLLYDFRRLVEAVGERDYQKGNARHSWYLVRLLIEKLWEELSLCRRKQTWPRKASHFIN